MWFTLEDRPVASLHADRFEDEARLLAYLQARRNLAAEIGQPLGSLVDLLRDRAE